MGLPRLSICLNRLALGKLGYVAAAENRFSEGLAISIRSRKLRSDDRASSADAAHPILFRVNLRLDSTASYSIFQSTGRRFQWSYADISIESF